ncbi:hypothetical protein HDU86_003331 [Geranomyces michiganensis]|nr:hypothetical protein HDU86_003331 [Geranomyces michiganensis]
MSSYSYSPYYAPYPPQSGRFSPYSSLFPSGAANSLPQQLSAASAAGPSQSSLPQHIPRRPSSDSSFHSHYDHSPSAGSSSSTPYGSLSTSPSGASFLRLAPSHLARRPSQPHTHSMPVSATDYSTARRASSTSPPLSSYRGSPGSAIGVGVGLSHPHHRAGDFSKHVPPAGSESQALDDGDSVDGDTWWSENVRRHSQQYVRNEANGELDPSGLQQKQQQLGDFDSTATLHNDDMFKHNLYDKENDEIYTENRHEATDDDRFEGDHQRMASSQYAGDIDDSRSTTPTQRNFMRQSSSQNPRKDSRPALSRVNSADRRADEAGDSGVHLVSFSAATFILINILPFFSSWSRGLRIHLGVYPGLALTIAASVAGGALLRSQRVALWRIFTYTRAHPASRELGALLATLAFGYVCTLFAPLTFRALHSVAARVPVVGALAVYIALLSWTFALGLTAVCTLGFLSWDVTKVVHLAVVRVIRYIVAPDDAGESRPQSPEPSRHQRKRPAFHVVNTEGLDNGDDDLDPLLDAALAAATMTTTTTTTTTPTTANVAAKDGNIFAAAAAAKETVSHNAYSKGKMSSSYSHSFGRPPDGFGAFAFRGGGGRDTQGDSFDHKHFGGSARAY